MSLTGKHLHLDCFAGVAGDMFLGAALDLGVSEAPVRQALEALAIGGFELRVGRREHMGIVGCDVKVVPGVPHEVHQHHGDGHGRHYREIRAMIEQAALADGVKRRALDIFARIARAEGKMHGVDPERVHFHEVGAIDSIVDVIGAAVALDVLAPTRITSRPVPLGHGYTRCAHGRIPVPAPAALEILSGCDIEDGGADIELCTPTGAAIIASSVTEFCQLPAGRLLAVGYGAGDRELPDRPNHLRAVLLEPDPALASAGLPAERLIELEANVDNMSGEWAGYLMERLLGAGALDVWFTPIVMKKSRPALTISVLCGPSQRVALCQLLVAESTTIGVRYRPLDRWALDRRSVSVDTPYGSVEVKLALAGDEIVNVAPEFESCRAAAERNRAPLKTVFAAAITGYSRLASADAAE